MTASSREEQFLTELKTLGGAAANGPLRIRLGWEDAHYNDIKRALVEKGLVLPSRGRGGGVRVRATGDAVEPLAVKAKPARAVAPRGATKTGFAAVTQMLWSAADKLRGNLDAAEYKHVALGLIFLKCISDRFEERRAQALAEPRQQLSPALSKSVGHLLPADNRLPRS